MLLLLLLLLIYIIFPNNRGNVVVGSRKISLVTPISDNPFPPPGLPVYCRLHVIILTSTNTQYLSLICVQHAIKMEQQQQQ
jgi:hypothetical protein